MVNNQITFEYALRYGGIEEVLAGEGKPVESYEELYTTGKPSLTSALKVIGVNQTSSFGYNTSFEEKYNQAAQDMVILKFNAQDEVYGDLIGLIYDSHVLSEDFLRILTSRRDILGRLNLSDYRSVPDFKEKSVLCRDRVANLVFRAYEKRNHEKAVNLLYREAEYLALSKILYGLTRPEATYFNSLKYFLEYMKHQFSDEVKSSSDCTAKNKSKSVRVFFKNMASRMKDKFTLRR